MESVRERRMKCAAAINADSIGFAEKGMSRTNAECPIHRRCLVLCEDRANWLLLLNRKERLWL